MSLAFSTLLLILLTIPGILARYWYRKGVWSAPVEISTIPEELISGFVWALPIQFAWAWIARTIADIDVNLDIVLVLLSGRSAEGLETAKVVSSLDRIGQAPELFFIYLFGVNLFAITCGFLGHLIVRSLKLDIQFPFFRFKNEWYYLLKGETLAFNENLPGGSTTPSRQEIDKLLANINTYITVDVEQAETPYLYRGIVREFFFNREGELDRLVLADAHRRRLDRDRHPEDPSDPERDNDEFYSIQGEYLVICYSSVKTLNIEYFALVVVETQEES